MTVFQFSMTISQIMDFGKGKILERVKFWILETVRKYGLSELMLDFIMLAKKA